MSFFKDIKDELAQTVNNMEAEDKNDADSLLSGNEETDGLDEELLESLFEDDSMIEKTKDESVATENTKELTNVSAEEQKEESIASASPVLSEVSEEDRDIVTLITRGTTINGGMVADCSLDIMGTVNGDVECLGKLTVSGTVKGNCMASEIYLSTERLVGSVISEGSVKISHGTVVIGNLTASSAVIAGAVKGDIDVTGPVIIDSTAIIKGNIKAKSVQMNNGAVLEGFCSLAYASVSIDNIFE